MSHISEEVMALPEKENREKDKQAVGVCQGDNSGR